MPSLQGNGILGLQLGSRQPFFALLLQGDAVLTETGQSAVFLIVAMFLQLCRRNAESIGGRSLEYLRLGSIMESKRFFSLHNMRKLRIW